MRTFGEFAAAVYAQRMWQATARELVEFNADLGGFPVPKQLANDLLMRTYERSLAGMCTPFPMGSDQLGIPTVDETSRADGSRYGGAACAWLDSGVALTASKPKLGLLGLGAKKLGSLAYITNELLADVPALEQYLMTIFSGDMGAKLDDAIIRGSGAGQPLGVLNSTAKTIVSKESGQGANTITGTNVAKMWARLWGPSRDRAVWLANENTATQLLALSTPIFGVTGDVVAGQPLPSSQANGIFGRPILWRESCSTLGTEGDLILFDPTQYVVGHRGMHLSVSQHVRFASDETAFRLITRVDGQPSWRVPVTPKNGTETLSTIVTLATRA